MDILNFKMSIGEILVYESLELIAHYFCEVIHALKDSTVAGPRQFAHTFFDTLDHLGEIDLA